MTACPIPDEQMPTEAEILDASNDNYMDSGQLAFFRARLLRERDALIGAAEETALHLQQQIDAPADPLDRATLEEDHMLELRVRDRERKLLQKINKALARIENGSYGWCEETDEPIGVRRLMARPTATLTVEAQELRELRRRVGDRFPSGRRLSR